MFDPQPLQENKGVDPDRRSHISCVGSQPSAVKLKKKRPLYPLLYVIQTI